MYFAALLKLKPGARRPEQVWRCEEPLCPASVRLVAEYWLETPEPQVILITEAATANDLLLRICGWEDLYEITVAPTVPIAEVNLHETHQPLA